MDDTASLLNGEEEETKDPLQEQRDIVMSVETQLRSHRMAYERARGGHPEEYCQSCVMIMAGGYRRLVKLLGE